VGKPSNFPKKTVVTWCNSLGTPNDQTVCDFFGENPEIQRLATIFPLKKDTTWGITILRQLHDNQRINPKINPSKEQNWECNEK